MGSPQMVQISSQKFRWLKKPCSNLLSLQNCGGNVTRTDLHCEIYYMLTWRPRCKYHRTVSPIVFWHYGCGQKWEVKESILTFENTKFKMVELKLDYSHKRRPDPYFPDPVLQTLSVYWCICSKQSRGGLSACFLFQHRIDQRCPYRIMQWMGYFSRDVVNFWSLKKGRLLT